MAIVSSKFQSGRVIDASGNGAYIIADNDSTSEYAGFGFTAGFEITYDGIFYKEWGRLYFDSNSNGIYEGTHVYTSEASGIIDSTIGFGGEGIDEHYGYWYSLEYTRDRGNDVELAIWNRSIDSWVGDFEGIDGIGRFEIISDINFDTTNGDDHFVGSTNNDQIFGKNGNDIFVGRPGNDRLYGESGQDSLYGDSGNDYLSGGSSADKLYGGSGKDRLVGGTSSDKLYGGSSSDRLYGDSGKDYLKGDSGNDKLYGGSSSDRLYGDSGKDYLKGDSGNDKLFGGSSKDVLIGGKGKDDVYGGSGRDIFRLTKGSGYDRIRDFEKRSDKIFIKGLNSLKVKDAGRHAKIYSGKDLLAVVYNEDNLGKSGNFLI